MAFFILMPNFKYSININNLNLKTVCPPETYKGRDEIVFRFAYSDINHPDTFKPQFVKKMPRQLPSDESKTCDGYGLSLFISIESSIFFFNEILNNRLRQLLGYTHISSGRITTNDGVTTLTDDNGHFNLHEYEGVDLLPNFLIVQPISIK